MASNLERLRAAKEKKSTNNLDRFQKIKAAAPSEPQAPSDYRETNTVASLGGNYAAGVNETIDKVLRWVPDQVIRKGLVAAGVNIDPEGQPTMFGNAASKIDARTPAESASRKAGNLTAEAVPMIAGANAAAMQKGLQTTADITKFANNPSVMSALKATADDAIRFIQNNPGKAGMGEGVLAVASGIGGGIASEESGGNPIAESLGMVAGGSLPSAAKFSTVGLAVRGGRLLRNNLSPTALQEHAEGVINKQLRGELTIEAKSNISKAADVKNKFAERGETFNPTLAEQTGSQGLIRSQLDIEDNLSGSELDQFVARKRGDQIAIENFTGKAAPESEPIPEYIIDTVSESVSKDASALKGQKSAVADDAKKLGGGIKQSDRFAEGSKIRDRLFALRSEKRTELDSVAESLGINGQDVTEDYSTWAKSVVQELAPESKLFSDIEQTPSVIPQLKSVLQKANPKPGKDGKTPKAQKVTFKDVKALRERVSDDLIDAMTGQSPSRKKVRSLTVLKKRIDDLITEIPESMVDQEMKTAYQDFRTRYFDEYINRFERGAAFDVKRKDGRGFFMTDEEKIGDAFFEKGGISAARQFKATFGDDPEAVGAMRNIVFDRFREEVVRDGVVDPGLYKNWMREHDSVLREFPELKTEFKDVGSAVSGLLNRQAQIKARETFLDTRSLTKMIRSYDTGGTSPEAILNSVLNNEKKYADFIGRVKEDKSAYMGFKRWLWDKAIDEKNTEKFILQNESVLNDVLGKEHMEDIKTILVAKEIFERTPMPRGREVEQNIFKDLQEKTGIGVPQLISRYMAISRGRSSKFVEGGGSLANFWGARSTKQQKALMREALYDPEFAALLTDAATVTKMPKDRKQKLNAWLFNAGMQPFTEEE